MTTSPYEISTDRSRLNLERIHQWIASSYWATDIPLALVKCSIDNSLCFGAYLDSEQVGIARVITDFATFAYVADVFVVTEHRGKGVGKALMQAIQNHPELQGIRRFLLITLDAHGLYSQFGYQPIQHAERIMTIHKPNMYQADTIVS